MSILDLNYKIFIAKSLDDYLYIRNLRNKNRNYMTNKNFPIGIIRQIFFWLKKDKKIDIFIVKVGTVRYGYFLIKEDADKNYITEVVDNDFRELGIGKLMISYAQKKYSNLCAEIFNNNLPSIKLHVSMNFKKIKSKGLIDIYSWENNAP
jgi:hypothetical protein